MKQDLRRSSLLFLDMRSLAHWTRKENLVLVEFRHVALTMQQPRRRKRFNALFPLAGAHSIGPLRERAPARGVQFPQKESGQLQWDSLRVAHSYGECDPDLPHNLLHT